MDCPRNGKDLLVQVLILFGQSVNTCSYVKKFKILIAFVNNQKKDETITKVNSQAFTDKVNSKMLFGPEFKYIIGKSLPLKSKSKEIFGPLSQLQQSTSLAPSDGGKQNPFPRIHLFKNRRNRNSGRGSFNLIRPQFLGMPQRGNISFLGTTSHHSPLLSSTEFNQIHTLIASLFPLKISNVPRTGRLQYFVRN